MKKKLFLIFIIFVEFLSPLQYLSNSKGYSNNEPFSNYEIEIFSLELTDNTTLSIFNYTEDIRKEIQRSNNINLKYLNDQNNPQNQIITIDISFFNKTFEHSVIFTLTQNNWLYLGNEKLCTFPFFFNKTLSEGLDQEIYESNDLTISGKITAGITTYEGYTGKYLEHCVCYFINVNSGGSLTYDRKNNLLIQGSSVIFCYFLQTILKNWCKSIALSFIDLKESSFEFEEFKPINAIWNYLSLHIEYMFLLILIIASIVILIITLKKKHTFSNMILKYRSYHKVKKEIQKKYYDDIKKKNYRKRHSLKGY